MQENICEYFLSVLRAEVCWAPNCCQRTTSCGGMMYFPQTAGHVVNWMDSFRGRSQSVLLIVKSFYCYIFALCILQSLFGEGGSNKTLKHAQKKKHFQICSQKKDQESYKESGLTPTVHKRAEEVKQQARIA